MADVTSTTRRALLRASPPLAACAFPLAALAGVPPDHRPERLTPEWEGLFRFLGAVHPLGWKVAQAAYGLSPRPDPRELIGVIWQCDGRVPALCWPTVIVDRHGVSDQREPAL